MDILFDSFRLSSTDESLWKGSARIHLRPKSYAFLRYLAAHPGELITKDQLLAGLWPGCHVSEEALKHCVVEIRKVLDDQARNPRFIETVHRRGYRFIGALEIRKQDTSIPATQSHLDSHVLEGRAQELDQLRRNLKLAFEGNRQIVFITGEQGIGKTTLVDTFAGLAAEELEKSNVRGSARKLRVARGHCIQAQGSGEPFMPFCEAIADLFDASGRQTLVAFLRQYAPLWLVQMPYLLHPSQMRRLKQTVSGATSQRALREMTEAIEALCEEEPLLLILEDLHWGDQNSMDLISFVAQRRKRAKLLVLATCRPTEAAMRENASLRIIMHNLQARRQCEELPLGFLNERAVDGYLGKRFPNHAFPDEMTRWLQERTAGNPLFLAALVDHMVAREFIVRRDETYALPAALDGVELTIPAAIQQVIERQVEICSPPERRLLLAASVVGRKFSVAEIAAVLGEKVDRVDLLCRSLSHTKRFLQSHSLSGRADIRSAMYGFVHPLFQAACCQMLPSRMRLRLHRRIAQIMKNKKRKPGGHAACMHGCCCTAPVTME